MKSAVHRLVNSLFEIIYCFIWLFFRLCNMLYWNISKNPFGKLVSYFYSVIVVFRCCAIAFNCGLYLLHGNIKLHSLPPHSHLLVRGGTAVVGLTAEMSGCSGEGIQWYGYTAWGGGGHVFLKSVWKYHSGCSGVPNISVKELGFSAELWLPSTFLERPCWGGWALLWVGRGGISLDWTGHSVFLRVGSFAYPTVGPMRSAARTRSVRLLSGTFPRCSLLRGVFPMPNNTKSAD